MKMFSKKGEIETSMLVKIILYIAAAVVIGGIVWMVVGGINMKDMKEYGCWASNGFRSGSIITKELLPSACDIFNVEEPVDMKGLASMMKKSWWMYGKGDWDFEAGDDKETMVYFFSVSEDIDIMQFMGYLYATRDGTPVGNLADSDYTYLEKGSQGRTICTGKQIHGTGGAEGKPILKKLDSEGRPAYYYIMFWDDTEILGQGGEYGDKIVIAGKPNLKQEGAYYCWSLVDQSQLVEIPYGGDRRYIINRIAGALGL
ncbi:MAG: hypothetical protein PHO02_01360 [Candidatus Nanoarchaeia archaeon]|nr:hypothetical protein [Candidatus Nanoarchaeia archaeon]